MTPKEKAKELIEKFKRYSWISCFEGCEELSNIESAKYCALIAVENEYKALREQLFNIRACGIIIGEKVYLTRLQQLIDEEKEVKQELEKL